MVPIKSQRRRLCGCRQLEGCLHSFLGCFGPQFFTHSFKLGPSPQLNSETGWVIGGLYGSICIFIQYFKNWIDD